MKLVQKSFKSEPEIVDGRAVLAELDRRLAELGKRRDAITAEIILVEKANPPQGLFAATATNARAEALLGGAEFVAPEADPLSRLERLLAERATVDLALRIGTSRQARAAAEVAGDIYAANFAEIAALDKRRVMLALELQGVDRARERLREKLADAGCSGVSLPTDGVDLLGLGDMADEVLWCANRLIADGIATRAEINKARADG